MNSVTKSNLQLLEIDNSLLAELPGDNVSENYTRQVNNACYSHVTPEAFPDAYLIACSNEMAQVLGIDPETCGSDDFVKLFSGTQLLETMKPYANCYGGFQFGQWAGQLGDGRAINLGDVKTHSGEHWTLQLKGAGPTPYSRTADGYAVLRSSVREFLCSEAMHHLGVATTRALCLLGTGKAVVRDMFYDGHPQKEPGAIVCRVAQSFTRFGSFEIFAARNQLDVMQQLVDFTITRDFSHLGKPGKETYLAWYQEICQSTSAMIVDWMRVGFVHGVMNTDNMSILGQTIDYGPYGWLEDYDPEWTPNTTDSHTRRYKFGQQPAIALWNLVQLANAIHPLIDDIPALENILDNYRQQYEQDYLAMMVKKLGLSQVSDNDLALVNDLTRTLTLVETDMTLFYRHLSDIQTEDVTSPELLLHKISPSFYADEIPDKTEQAFIDWLSRYCYRLKENDINRNESIELMNTVNPLYVLRNYLAQQAIDKATEGDYNMIDELQTVLKQPYTFQEGKDHLAEKRPDWARHKAGCSMLSCSS